MRSLLGVQEAGSAAVQAPPRLRVVSVKPAAPGTAAADALERLREATNHYERHVLAWYALGRPNEARAARARIAECQAALSACR